MTEAEVARLEEKLEALEEKVEEGFERNDKKHGEIMEALGKVNGKVAENTKFRYIAYGVLLAVTFLSSTALVWAIADWIVR